MHAARRLLSVHKGEHCAGPIDLGTVVPLREESKLVQQFLRALDGHWSEVGNLKQVITGPYHPLGFETLVDGAYA